MALILAMVVGFTVYFRLWTIDNSISYYDAELIRSAYF